MFGLTRIDAFIIDEHNQDCLLIGAVDPHFPALQLGDFVTALRNVWLSPGDPACSIDPRQEDMALLGKIVEESRQATNPEQIQKTLCHMMKIGKRLQQVTVFGVPFKSSFAQGMVVPDYHCKKVAAGTLPHPLGFKSFRDLSFDWLVAQAKQNCGTATGQLSVMARFWFHPAPPTYEEAKDIFFLKEVGVQLLTEEEHIGVTGQRIQTGRGHPSAEEFRRDFTAYYREIARHEPEIYAPLRSLYRLTALGIFLKRRQVFERTGLDLNFWLHTYPQDHVDVPETLAGISDLKQDKITCSGPLGMMEGPMWMPICGGVTVSRNVIGDPSRVTTDTGALGRLTQVVLNAEPTLERRLFWDFPLRGIELEEF